MNRTVLAASAAALLLVAGIGWTASRNAQLKKRLDSLGAQYAESHRTFESWAEREKARADARRVSRRNQENLRRELVNRLREVGRLRTEMREKEIESGMRAEAEKRSEREADARQQREEGRVETLAKDLEAARAARKAAERTAAERAAEAKKAAAAAKTLSARLAQYEKSGLREESEAARLESEKAAAALQEANSRYESMRQETAVAHYNLGVLYARNAQHREAAREFELALSVNPNDPWAHYNLGLLYDTHLADPEGALRHYESYVRLLPTAADAKRVESRILQVRLQQKAGIGRDLSQA